MHYTYVQQIKYLHIVPKLDQVEKDDEDRLNDYQEKELLKHMVDNKVSSRLFINNKSLCYFWYLETCKLFLLLIQILPR